MANLWNFQCGIVSVDGYVLTSLTIITNHPGIVVPEKKKNKIDFFREIKIQFFERVSFKEFTLILEC